MGFCKIDICHNTGKLNYLVVLKEHSGNGCGKKILLAPLRSIACFPSLPSLYKGKHENEIPSFLVYSDLLNLILNIAKNPFSCNADLIMSSNIVMEECDELSEKAPVERIFLFSAQCHAPVKPSGSLRRFKVQPFAGLGKIVPSGKPFLGWELLSP